MLADDDVTLLMLVQILFASVFSKFACIFSVICNLKHIYLKVSVYVYRLGRWDMQ